MHFSLCLSDGTEAISTFGEEPLEFAMGDGTLVEGLELALYGMRPAQEQSLELTPQQAFGPRDRDKIHLLPRTQFAADMPLDPGTVIAFDGPDGEPLAGTVLGLNDDKVEVDFNHPLAGHSVIFRVRILDVKNPPATPT
jgi:FKBP-type peptidyl-prolyl cis-trans isomerase SlpA